MSFHVKFQTDSRYRSIAYGDNSIYNSACGPASLCNALCAAGIADIDIPTMCKLAVSCGARVDGGTVMATLLRAAAPNYHFAFRSTSKNAELLAHLQAGGVAILHAGSEYPLFSSSGHFVAAVAVSGQTVTVLDSYWYSGKYTSTALRRNNISVVSNGVVKTSLVQCGKATADRCPSYYLISREVITEATPKQEDDEVIEKTQFEIGEEKTTIDAITKGGHTFVNLQQFNQFLGLLTNYDAATGIRAVDFSKIKVSVNGKNIEVSGMLVGAGHAYAAVRGLLESMGYHVNWDEQTKTIIVNAAETAAQ